MEERRRRRDLGGQATELEIHGLPDEVVCQSWPVVVEAWGGVQGRRLLRTYLETQVSRQKSGL